MVNGEIWFDKSEWWYHGYSSQEFLPADEPVAWRCWKYHAWEGRYAHRDHHTVNSLWSWCSSTMLWQGNQIQQDARNQSVPRGSKTIKVPKTVFDAPSECYPKSVCPSVSGFILPNQCRKLCLWGVVRTIPRITLALLLIRHKLGFLVGHGPRANRIPRKKVLPDVAICSGGWISSTTGSYPWG